MRSTGQLLSLKSGNIGLSEKHMGQRYDEKKSAVDPESKKTATLTSCDHRWNKTK